MHVALFSKNESTLLDLQEADSEDLRISDSAGFDFKLNFKMNLRRLSLLESVRV